MASNYYGQQDPHITKALDAMHQRLRNGTGGGSSTGVKGFHDRAKPSLNDPLPAPLRITNAVPQRIILRMPWE